MDDLSWKSEEAELFSGGGEARVASGGVLELGFREGRLKIRRGLGTRGAGGDGDGFWRTVGVERM